MKRLLLIVAVCLLGAVEASAQYYPRNIIGVRGGMNISTMSLRADGADGLNDIRQPKVGWHVGVVDEILLVDDMPLYLDVGITLSNKGVRYVSESSMEGFDSSVQVTSKGVYQFGGGYLQFPVCVSYHLYFGDFALQPYAGLHYDVGLWGRLVASEKVKSKTNPELNSRTRTVENLYQTHSLRRSDFGVMLGVGVTYRERYYFGVSWEDGIRNVMPKDYDVKFRNLSNFRISVGYNF